MEKSETTRILVEKICRAVMSVNCPVYIDLVEYKIRISVLEHIFDLNLTLDLFHLKSMVMITELHSKVLTFLTYGIEVVTDDLKFLKCIRLTDMRNDNIFHSCRLVCRKSLIPPCESLADISCSQFLL